MTNEFDYNLEIKCQGCGNFIKVKSSWIRWPHCQRYTCLKCGRIYIMETVNPGDKRKKTSVRWSFKVPFTQIIIQKIIKQENAG